MDNKKGPREYLDKFWVDSLVHDQDALATLVKLFGAKQVRVVRAATLLILPASAPRSRRLSFSISLSLSLSLLLLLSLVTWPHGLGPQTPPSHPPLPLPIPSLRLRRS